MPTLDTTYTWTIKINNVDVTQYVDSTSIAMTDAEGTEVDTLYFQLADTSGALDIASWQSVQWSATPAVGSKVEWFGGLIVSAESAALEDALGRLWRVKAEGYQTLLARGAVHQTIYIAEYPGDIAIDILDQAGLTAQDQNVDSLSYIANTFQDTGQDFGDWETTSGDAAYAIVVTNSDQTQTWGYCGAASGAGNRIVAVYKDIELSTAGWNGTSPSGKTPTSYYVRRAYQFSGHRPIGVTHVVTGASTLTPFATNADDTIPATLTRLAQEVGWVWRLDAEAELYFGPASNDPAPFDVADGANANYTSSYPALAGSVSINRNGMEMINQVVIHGGAKESTLQIESFLYSSGSTIFRLSHRNLIDITVWLNGTVVADGTVWWHTFGDYVVLVNYAEGWIWFNTLANDDSITVHYHYYEELLYTLRDETSIAAARQVFTKHVWDRSITSDARAAAVAQAVLAEYGPELVTGSFEIWRLGLRAGQQIHLTFAQYGIDADYTIRKLDCRTDPSNTGLLCFVQFGGRTPNLSDLIYRPAPLADVWYGNFANLTNVAISQPQKPISDNAYLTKRDTTTVDASGGAVTVTLPPAIVFRGRTVRVVKIDSSVNPVNVEPSAGETINSASSTTLSSQWDAMVLFSTGEDWIAWLTSDAGSGGGGCGSGAADWTATFEAVDAYVTVENGCVTEITWKSTAIASNQETAIIAGILMGAAMADTVYGGA